MESIYYTLNNPASYGGIQQLARETKNNVKDTKDWLMTQDTYTLHKPVIRKFPRRKTYSTCIDDLWQADLVDLSSIANYNDNNRYILTCIDVFSRYAWAVPCKNKMAKTVCMAFECIITERKPKYLQTDKGSEFLNGTFQTLLKENDIKFYTSENDEIKCALVERFNRTLKGRMFRYFTHKSSLRYIDILQHLVCAYNDKIHSSIKIAPSNVFPHIEEKLRALQYTKKKGPIKYKFSIGDTVRISETRRTFKKGYLPHWTEEILTINERFSTQPPTYGLIDAGGENIKGKFYTQELQKVVKTDDTFKIESVLKTRKKAGKTEYFVKWLGYPSKFNSWVANLING
jgi:transposase InsO family protein